MQFITKTYFSKLGRSILFSNVSRILIRIVIEMDQGPARLVRTQIVKDDLDPGSCHDKEQEQNLTGGPFFQHIEMFCFQTGIKSTSKDP